LRVFGFGAVVLVLALGGAFLASPWVDASVWKIFRRCVSISAAVTAWLFIIRFKGLTFRDYGLVSFMQGKSQFLFGAGLGLASLAVLLMAGQASGASHIAIHPDSAKLWRTLIGFIPAACLVAVLEELVFRGLILRELLPSSRLLAVTVSSALYAGVHLRDPGMTAYTWLELAGLFLLGAVLAVSCLNTGSLWTAIGLHAVLAYGARVNKLVLAIPESSWWWLTGTSRLVNGVAAWGLILLSGWIIWRRSRKHGEGIA